MSSREEFEAWCDSVGISPVSPSGVWAWNGWNAGQEDLLSALQAITNSGPDAIPIKEAFEMAHGAIERATGEKV